MNAPLSRHLAHFSAVPPPAPEPDVSEPDALLDFAEFDDLDPEPDAITSIEHDLAAQLDAARSEAQRDAEEAHAQALAELAAHHEARLAEALEAARAEWIESQAATLGAQLTQAFATLHEQLADALAQVLQPLLAETVRARALEALVAALARVTADRATPVLTLTGPHDLVAALRENGAPAGLKLVGAETGEAVVVTNGTQIETRLAAALADLTVQER